MDQARIADVASADRDVVEEALRLDEGVRHRVADDGDDVSLSF